MRIKNNPYGGPDGGNGGHGGHVIFNADPKTKDFARVQTALKSRHGENGRDKCCHGRSATHAYVNVPLNTLVKTTAGEIVYELTKPGELFIAARGGAGGHGNHFYLSNDVRAPLKAELGGKGEVVG